jgi:hypothetical protein
VLPDQIPVTPAWCLTDKELIVGVFPQTIISHLANQGRAQPLVQSPQVAGLFNESGPLTFTYVDMKTLVSWGYPFLQMGAAAGLSEARRQGINLDISVLPAPGAIIPHLGPSVSECRRTADGIEIVQRQAVPGGSIGSSAPVAVALLLPAVQSAREAARRTQSANNLKQIMLAMHNYHDTYRHLPAAYGLDKDGQPLLSWRVYILPFVEQANLFNQFHLDEPWDSEHNIKLVEQMPAVYRSPKSSAAPGMTTYLTPRGESTLFPPTNESEKGKPMPRGLGFASVTDGTSNTIAVLEVNDDRAVIWTKPDDYEYDPADPLAAVYGVYAQGFQAAFCDGSVQFLNYALDRMQVLGAFTRNGGEVIQFR